MLLAINQGVLLKDIDPKPFIDAHFEVEHPEISIELQENISVIVKQVNIKWPQTNFDKLIPHYQKSRNTNDFILLTDLVTQRLQQIKFKNKTISQKYHERLQRELLVIKTCRLASYFLIVYDYVHYAKTHDIMVGPGRGSAAGSLVSYLLDITTVDPIRFNLIFERFLNVGRVQLPDIDIDVQDDQRIKLIKYLQKKYGINHVCYINTFQRLKIKIALRDISRAFNIPLNEVNQIAKAIGRQTYSEFMVSTAEKNSIAYFYYTKYQQIFQHMHLLINLPRHAGTHAAGVILSRRPLIKHLPMTSGNDGVQKTQLDMHDLATLGFLKMDILGLTNLTILSKLKQKLGKSYQLPTSTFRDEKTLALLKSGAVSGIFQLESPGMQDLLMKIKPGSLEDIAVTMALFRPGPLE